MDVQAQIIAEAQRQGVDPALALGVAKQESAFNQSARSSQGAIGIFQLMPSTASDLGVNPTDATQNIKGGITYLKQMLNQFGSVDVALEAYNFGQGHIQRGDPLPPETVDYVTKVTGYASEFGYVDDSSPTTGEDSAGNGSGTLSSAFSSLTDALTPSDGLDASQIAMYAGIGLLVFAAYSFTQES